MSYQRPRSMSCTASRQLGCINMHGEVLLDCTTERKTIWYLNHWSKISHHQSIRHWACIPFGINGLCRVVSQLQRGTFVLPRTGHYWPMTIKTHSVKHPRWSMYSTIGGVLQSSTKAGAHRKGVTNHLMPSCLTPLALIMASTHGTCTLIDSSRTSDHSLTSMSTLVSLPSPSIKPCLMDVLRAWHHLIADLPGWSWTSCQLWTNALSVCIRTVKVSSIGSPSMFILRCATGLGASLCHLKILVF